MRKVRENIIASSGDYEIFPAGQDVYNSDGSINVLPGQYVFYDPQTLKSVGATTIAANPKLVMGVGIDTTGDGATDSIRKTYGDVLHGHSIGTVSAEPPRSGTAHIKDFLFEGAENDTAYTVNITVEDDITQNVYPYNRPANYTATVMTSITGTTPEELACLLVDKINNSGIDSSAGKTSVFNKLRKSPTDLPFYAVRLFEQSHTYCLPTVAGACNTCINVPAITGMVANGQTTTFTNTVNPQDGTLTLKAQIDRIISLINVTLDGNGSAAITGGVGNFIEQQLEVNTCFADFELLDADGNPMAKCSTSNPFDPVTLAAQCKNCGTGTFTTVYEGGIRLIAKRVDASCNGNIPANPPKGYFGRRLGIFPAQGFSSGTVYTRDVQKITLPENFGYLWQWRDYVSDNGGTGRGHDQFNSGSYGPMDLPLARSRSMSASRVSCKTPYCSFIIEHTIPSTDIHTHGNVTGARGRTVFLIPSSDSVTIADFETKFNAYTSSSVLQSIGAVTCAADQDQDPAEKDLEGEIV